MRLRCRCRGLGRSSEVRGDRGGSYCGVVSFGLKRMENGNGRIGELVEETGFCDCGDGVEGG